MVSGFAIHRWITEGSSSNRISTKTKHILTQVRSYGAIHMTFQLNICRYLAHHELESVSITVIILMIIKVVVIVVIF